MRFIEKKQSQGLLRVVNSKTHVECAQELIDSSKRAGKMDELVGLLVTNTEKYRETVPGLFLRHMDRVIAATAIKSALEWPTDVCLDTIVYRGRSHQFTAILAGFLGNYSHLNRLLPPFLCFELKIYSIEVVVTKITSFGKNYIELCFFMNNRAKLQKKSYFFPHRCPGS